MTNLLRSVLGGSPARSGPFAGGSFQDYLNFLFQGSTYPLTGFSQTLQGDREEIGSGFMSYIAQGYRSNGIVFACELARYMVFSEGRFQYQRMENGRPGALWGNSELSILERPWGVGSTTGDLLARLLISADFAGTGFVVRKRSDRGTLRFVTRPDWMTIVLGLDEATETPELDGKLLGFMYHPGGHGSGKEPEVLLPDEVAYFAPTKDPLSRYRGIPWIEPVIREVSGDSAATRHKLKFFENGATPNMIVSLNKEIPTAKFREWVKLFKEKEPTGANAYQTLYLGGGATATVVGSDLQQLDFKAVQGAGETRIAAAAGVHPVIVGLSEGLSGSSLNAGNFSAARRRVADGTWRPLWREVSGSLEAIVPAPRGNRLWVDERDIAMLREDAKDRADIAQLQAQTLRTLADGGWEPDSVVAAVLAEDWGLLKHSGKLSVQLQEPGAQPDPAATGRALAQLIAPHLPALPTGDRS